MNNHIKTLCKYVLPTVLANCCFFLFTIVDGVFVGNGVGTDALGAVNLVMPYVMLINALFMLSTIGGVTVAAIRLGRGDSEGANHAFMHSLVFTVVTATVLCIAGTLLAAPITSLLGANETYFQLVYDYLFWYSLFLIPSGLAVALNGFCRNDGSPVLVSAAVIIGTVFNIFGDWLFVYPLQMGLKGAAIATGISQTLSLLIVCIHFLRKDGRLRITKFKFDRALTVKILGRGTPETVAQFTIPVATLCTNYVLLSQIGDVAVNAYSIICYVASFSAAIFFGTAEGMQPLFGQCYGAKDAKNLKFYLRAGLIINIVSSLMVTVLLFFVSAPVCALFGADKTTLDFTVAHIQDYSWGFIPASLNTLISAYFYSTKRTKEALILNVCRSFIISAAVILLLPLLLDPSLVWWTFVIYEGITFVLALFLFRSEKNGIVFR